MPLSRTFDGRDLCVQRLGGPWYGRTPFNLQVGGPVKRLDEFSRHVIPTRRPRVCWQVSLTAVRHSSQRTAFSLLDNNGQRRVVQPVDAEVSDRPPATLWTITPPATIFVIQPPSVRLSLSDVVTSHSALPENTTSSISAPS